MDEISAQNIIRTSIRVMALFNQLIGDLQKTLPKAAFDTEKLRIASIMGDAVGLINSAVELHPSLKVESDCAWRRAGELEATHWLRMVQNS